MTELLRDIGAHAEAIDTLKDEVSAMRRDIGEIKLMMSETKGGLRVLLSVGAVGGTVGAAIMKVVGMMKGGM